MSEEKNSPAESPPHGPAGWEVREPAAAGESPWSRRRRCRWWIKLFVQPLLFLAAGVLLIVGLGAAQWLGWISAGGGSRSVDSGGEGARADANVRYICPMMCTPPQTQPGRCPVCAMELVPAASGGGDTDERSIEIDPVARRVANILTVPVKSVPLVRNIRAIGELSYDEGTLKTIAAYVDGRLDRLYADYTGVVVQKGDHLALLYSPQLYSSQVELLVAKRSRERTPLTMSSGAGPAGRDLYQSARERLIEFGMTASQVEDLERAGEATSRMHLCTPISGTVIEKLAVQGQYVKTGQPIYRLADLSTVWLMLELFPEDAAAIRDGQAVEAEVQSLPGRKFTGRVAFIDPTVEPRTRTVGVRVVIPNDEGLLRVGDYARATIAVELGVTSESGDGVQTLVVPRNAVLMAGDASVVYVETEQGRFEVRRVVLGPSSGDEIAVLEGLEEGEQVACSGNFLIDSQMQLAGKPSLIDPARAGRGDYPLGDDSRDSIPQMDLPPIGVPEIVESEAEETPIEAPPPGDGEVAQ
jgi:Cu(I)/Ag(I) efflux system membrane fusion protein